MSFYIFHVLRGSEEIIIPIDIFQIEMATKEGPEFPSAWIHQIYSYVWLNSLCEKCRNYLSDIYTLDDYENIYIEIGKKG